MLKKAPQFITSLLESCISHKSHKQGRILHAHILRNFLSHDTFISNRLIEFYSKCNDPKLARYVFDQMSTRDVYSWNAILSSCCNSNSLEIAYKVFDEMPERNVVSWNNMISAFVRNLMYDEALGFYFRMVCEGLTPTRFTLASVLSACGGLMEVDIGRMCHGFGVKIGVDENLYVGNALLSMYAKCGYVWDAIRVFSELLEPNEVSFTALIGGLVDRERVDEALEMFKLMHRSRVCIDAVSLSSILGFCSRGTNVESMSCVIYGQVVHCLSVKLGFENDFHLSNSLLDMYAKNGDMGSAERVFYDLPRLSVVSWNIMISGYGQNYKCDKAIELFHRMERLGYEPDEVTFINMLATCVKSGNIVVGRQVFDRMACPSLSSWNAMLSGYSQVEEHEEAIILFRIMQFKNIKPDRTTIAIVLGSCAEIGSFECGKEAHAVAQKAAFHDDMFVGSGLITLYSKSGKMDVAQLIFDRLPELDTVCWNSMMSGFSLNSFDKEVFDFLNRMRERNMSPTQFSYATLLSFCGKQIFSSQGKQIHALITKDGYMNDVFVGSALIGMYCKCGNTDEARLLYDAMPVKSVVTWNEMIHGYAQNGCGDEAVCLYNNMITSTEKADNITFVAVLTACSHSGLVDEGIRIFESMRVEHKFEPLLDHYTCIIDALGRAGRLGEAEVLITKMGCENDHVIWEVLLSSCRVHTDVPVARRAAEKLFCLNPESSTPYLLLANIYSSMGMWDDARAIRELMSDKNVGKDTGYTWIEYKDGKRNFENCESCSVES